MKARTTIYDIARKLNITAATVSRALNKNPKISKKTRELVIAAAADMNYKPNKLALALKSGRSHNVGIIVPRIDRNFFASVIRGMEEKLYGEGYHAIICQSHESEEFEIDNIDALINAQVDGIFMSTSSESQEILDAIGRIIGKGIPVVLFDRRIDLKGVSSVTIDDVDGAYKATQHLVDQGCQRIAHLAGDLSLKIYQERFEGYRRALVQNGLTINDELIIQTASEVDDGSNAVEALLANENPPDAIFSASDFAALGAIRKLKEKGLRLPQDFCVVGFSNEPFTKFEELNISTVDQSPVEMGRICAEVFIEKINDKSLKAKEKEVVLEPKLIVRLSSSRKRDT